MPRDAARIGISINNSMCSSATWSARLSREGSSVCSAGGGGLRAPHQLAGELLLFDPIRGSRGRLVGGGTSDLVETVNSRGGA